MGNTIEKTNGGWADRKRAINNCVDKINALTDLSVVYEDDGGNRLEVSDSNSVLRLTGGDGGGGLPDGTDENDVLYWDGSGWVVFSAPAITGTFVLGVVGGSMTWIAGEEC